MHMRGLMVPIFAFLCSGLLSFAQEIDKIPAITVSGKAEIQIAPDEVVFLLDVTKTNKDLQTAKRLSDECVAKIIELSRRYSILPKDIKTDYISVQMKYESIRDTKTRIFNADGDEIGKRTFKGYEVSKTVTIKLTDISRFETFFDEILKTGLSEVNSVKFETSKLRENRDKARELAMKAAKEKAAAMAAAVGQTVGKAIKIVEGSPNNSYGRGAGQNASNNLIVGSTTAYSESLATFAVGEIKIEAEVTVSFQLN
jgi:uncharacterized protein